MADNSKRHPADPTQTDAAEQQNKQEAQRAHEQTKDQPLDVQTPQSPAPQSTSTPTTDQILTAQEEERAKQEKLGRGEKRLDETVPGGRFLVNGQLVDANGAPLKG